MLGDFVLLSVPSMMLLIMHTGVRARSRSDRGRGRERACVRACVEKERGARESAADSRELVVNESRKSAERGARSAKKGLYPKSSTTSECADTTAHGAAVLAVGHIEFAVKIQN